MIGLKVWATLPLPLSFYCFQAMSYTIDVHRRDAKACESYLTYLTAVSFFPTTLAGPITRPAELIPQLERMRKLLPADAGRAFFLIGLGLIKKLLIADYIANNLVNRIFDLPTLYSGFEVLVAVYGYALQLYYDFSGYTDIAIASGLLLGLKLPRNFNAPYRAENIADFWRRWHITLSNWLRDYVYFSLPGLRSRWKVFAYGNLILTMAIGGIWHGLTWNFLVWGLLHGIGLATVRAFQAWRGNPKPSSSPWIRASKVFLTVQFVCFTWIFFRAGTLDRAITILQRIGSLTFSASNIPMSVAAVLLIAALLHYLPEGVFDRSLRIFVEAPALAQAAAMGLLLLAIQHVASTGSSPFLYTRF